MITKKFTCPNCKNVISFEGNPGEKKILHCPSCNIQGYVSFPTPEKKTILTPEYKEHSTIALEVTNLEFTYAKSKKKAIDNISFQMKEGEIFGFLGPNGAGKSTTQKIIMGLIKGYSGSVKILGKNLKDWGTKYYEHIGVCFEAPNHYQKLTAFENLELFSSFYSNKTIDSKKLLQMVDLEKDADQRVGSFSKGMKTKLNFIRALINNPDFLFLDEPTSGLDPVSARQVKNIILEQKKIGKTIFLTTHNMTDADELCDRVGFLVDGKLKLIENPKELRIRQGKKIVNVEFLHNNTLVKEEYNLQGLAANEQFLNRLNEGNVQTIHTGEATLEDIFIQVTGRQLK